MHRLSASSHSARLRTTSVAVGLLLLTAACGLKTSAVDNLKAAGSGDGATTGSLGGTGAGTGTTGLGGTTGSGTGTTGLGTGTGAGSSTGLGGTSGTSGSTGTSTTGGSSTSGSSGTTGVASGGACGVPTGGTTTGITKTTINIGLHAPLTGTGTPFPTESFRKGAQVYFDQPANKVCGRKVIVDFQDDKYTPDGANQVCTRFAATTFLAIGGAGTDQIQACATNTEMRRGGTPYLSAGVTDNGLTSLPNYFALSLTYKKQGTLVLRNAMTQGFAKPAPSTVAADNGPGNAQWAIITADTRNFDGATTGMTDALKAAGIKYKVYRFNQNGNYQASANQLGTQLALNGFKTIYTVAAPGVFVFVTQGYYQSSPSGGGVHWTGPGVTFTDFLVAQLTCQFSNNAISGAADYLAPAPGLDHATEAFKKAFNNSYDDIEWGLWLLDEGIHSMLTRANSNLTRQHFMETVLNGSFTSASFTPIVFNGGHFGGTGAWVQRIDCSKHNPDQPAGKQGDGYWNTVGNTYLKPVSQPALASSFDVTTQLVTPLVNGLFQGAAYGLLALGLVLLYKSNRIFNFAQGEFATVAAMVTYTLSIGYGVLPQIPYWLACLSGVVAAVLVALLTQLLVIRPMFDRPRVVVVVGTVGVALFLIGLEGTLFPKTGVLEPFPRHYGMKYAPTTIDRVQVPWTGIVTLAALVVLAVASFLFFRRTATGTAILAISQDSTAARTVGISVQRISLITWGLAGLLGGIAGVLLAQTQPIVAGGVTGIALTLAFTAAVLGGMTSLPGAFLGGVLLGLFQAFVAADKTLVPGLEQIPSVDELAVFLLLLVVLLIRPRGLLGKEA